MRIIPRFFRNINIFVVALIFSLAIVFLVKHPNILQASVLNVSEVTLIQQNKWDIAYKQTDWLLDIFFSSHIQTPITIVLAHDPSIYVDWSLFSGQCAFNILDSNEETTTITIDCPSFLSHESILMIPFSGKQQDILLEEGFYGEINNKKNLSIGNLSLSKGHSN